MLALGYHHYSLPVLTFDRLRRLRSIKYMNKWVRFLGGVSILEDWVQAIPDLFKWLTIGCMIGILTGTSSVGLLATLDWATGWRESEFPCLIAAIVGDRITLAGGLHDQVYRIPIVPELTIWGLLTAIAAGIIFGLTARVFATLTHQISDYFKAKISYPPFRPLIGRILVAMEIQTLMAIKLFGISTGSYAAIACVVSYLCAGHTGIYRSQQGGKKY